MVTFRRHHEVARFFVRLDLVEPREVPVQDSRQRPGLTSTARIPQCGAASGGRS